MSTKIFDTHGNRIIADRVIANLKSLGYSWNSGAGPNTCLRYIYAWEELGTERLNVLTHSSSGLDYDSEPHDCAWMAEDEVDPMIAELEEMQRQLERYSIPANTWAEATATTWESLYGVVNPPVPRGR